MTGQNAERLAKIQTNLIGWFSHAGRNFPWRETDDPYAVLIAEKLLQQTSVRSSVIEIYQELLARFPKPVDLSNGDPAELRKLIQPLGLNYRANDLVFMASDIVSKYNGRIPDNLNLLLGIYGVGDYAARAVLCFAYMHDVPVVDTNVARILYRIFNIEEKMPSNPARSKRLIALMGELIPNGHAREFNWAVIDLGALICRPRKPDCINCPVLYQCDFGRSNLPGMSNLHKGDSGSH